MSQVAPQILQLLFDPAMPDFARRSPLFHNSEKGLAGFFTIGSRLLVPVRLQIECVYDLFTELPGFIEQAQVGGVADRLRGDRCIQDPFAPMCRLLFQGRIA